MTLIIGDIDIEVDASDTSGIDRVEFYIDDQQMGTVTSDPYIWTWDKVAFFKHTIKVVAVDGFDNSAEEEILVRKFF